MSLVLAGVLISIGINPRDRTYLSNLPLGPKTVSSTKLEP